MRYLYVFVYAYKYNIMLEFIYDILITDFLRDAESRVNWAWFVVASFE